MRAVVMAGGEGTRLRPLTTDLPKPLLPVVNRPIMEHVLRLLRRHGYDETVVTVHFLGAMVRSYFGDGQELGTRITYATEARPLGTAGSVKNAQERLRDDTFLVISGDALTDVDLSALVDHHRERGALVTVCLARVPDPLDFGITVVDDEGRVQRFLEKPSWGQVFTDTVNTGIYVMEPEVLDRVPRGEVIDWSSHVLPELLELGAPVHGFVADGYWEDVGTHESYLRANVDALAGKVVVDLAGFEVATGIWVAEGAEVSPEAVLRGPAYIGGHVKIEGGAQIHEHTVLGDNVVVREGASLQHTVVQENAYIGPHTSLRGCIVGRRTDLMRGARLEDSSVVGADCVIQEEAVVQPGVHVYPGKTVEAGAIVHDNVIWESRGQRGFFGTRGVSGIVNVDLTPEVALRLAAAFATTLRKGARVCTARDGSRAAQTLHRAVLSALTASAVDVRSLDLTPAPVARHTINRGSAEGGIVVRTTPGRPDSVDILFLDEHGADLSPASQRRIERVLGRQEFRRAFPGEIGGLTFLPRVVDDYVRDVTACVDVSGVADSGTKVVVDAGRGAASLVLPQLIGQLGVDALLVNAAIDETRSTETAAEGAEALARLREAVASSQAAFGVRLDPAGERISLVDETGGAIDDGRATLVVVDLVAAEAVGGKVALPVTTTRVAEGVTRFHGVEVTWATTEPDALARATGPDTLIAGDGAGGFLIPELSSGFDGIAAFVRLLGLVARTKLPLSEIHARIPPTHVVRREVPTPWAVKGTVMRAVLEVAADRTVDTTDGVRVVNDDGSWVLVLPDRAQAKTLLWAEAGTEARAVALLDEWSAVVRRIIS